MFTVSLVLNSENQSAVADFLGAMMTQAEADGLKVETSTIHKELSLIEKIQTVDALVKEIAEEVDIITAMQKGDDNGENS